MKVKLQVSMHEDVVKCAKHYARSINTSVSKIVQEYLDKATQDEKAVKKNL